VEDHERRFGSAPGVASRLRMDDGLGRLARSGEGVRHRGFVGHSSGPCQAAPGRGHTGLRTGEPRAGLCRLEGLAEHEGGEGGAAPGGTVTHARAKPRCARVMAGELSRPGHSVSALCIRRGGFGSRRRGHACRRGDSFGKLIGMPGSGLAVTWRLGLLASGRHVA
jgi:hypothetical protein